MNLIEAPVTGRTPTASSAVIDYATEERLRFDVLTHEPTASALAEAKATGQPQHRVAKTVVLHDGAAYVFAVVPASHRVDLRKVRSILGASGSLRLATEAEMRRDFPALEIGAFPPVGPALTAAELIDVRVTRNERVVCAAGDLRHSLLLDPLEIVRVTDATVADICED